MSRIVERTPSWIPFAAWSGTAVFVAGTLLTHTHWRTVMRLVRLDTSPSIVITEALAPWGMASLAAVAAWKVRRGSPTWVGILLGASFLLAASVLPTPIYLWVAIEMPPGFPNPTPGAGGILQIAGIALIGGAAIVAATRPSGGSTPYIPGWPALAVAGIAAIVAGFFLPFETKDEGIPGSRSLVVLRFGLAYIDAVVPLVLLGALLACLLPGPIAALRGRSSGRLVGLASSAAALTVLMFASKVWRVQIPGGPAVGIGSWLAIGGGILVGLWAWSAIRGPVTEN